MVFIQPCFIRKNTQELRNKLSELGYTYSNCDNLDLDYIITFPSKGRYSIFADYHFKNEHFEKIWKIKYIDCGDNEELFLAIAALRDDTDYMQWFMIPNTKTFPTPGYCGQQGMNGYQQIITSVEYYKYDRKDNRISDMIKFEKEAGETILPRKLTIEELKLWFNYKIMPTPYKYNPVIKEYAVGIRDNPHIIK